MYKYFILALSLLPLFGCSGASSNTLIAERKMQTTPLINLDSLLRKGMSLDEARTALNKVAELGDGLPFLGSLSSGVLLFKHPSPNGYMVSVYFSRNASSEFVLSKWEITSYDHLHPEGR